MAATITELMRANLLEVFDQRDGALRRAAIARIYAADVRWTDEDGVTVGHAALDAKAVELQAKLGDLRFIAVGPTYQTLGLGYLAFHLVKPDSDAPVVSGFDVAIVRDGVIVELYTVLTDQPRHTRAIVEKLYKRIGAGDIEGVIDLLSDDFHWDIPGDTETVPWLGKRDTPQGVREFFALMGAHVDRQAMDINRIVVEGQDAVVLGRAAVIVRATGKLMDTLFAVHIVVDDDGRINRFVMFEDSWHVSAAMRP
jgi:ketosteroid isomerase-like protein